MTPAERETDNGHRRAIGPDPHVAVLVVFHQNVQHTLSSIGSAVALEYPSFEVLAVDDGSTDGCAAAVAAAYPTVRILRGDGTCGATAVSTTAYETACGAASSTCCSSTATT